MVMVFQTYYLVYVMCLGRDGWRGVFLRLDCSRGIWLRGVLGVFFYIITCETEAE